MGASGTFFNRPSLLPNGRPLVHFLSAFYRKAEVRDGIKAALNLGAVSYDAVKHLVLCRIEDKPPRLALQNYPHLPRARVETTSAKSYMALYSGDGA